MKTTRCTDCYEEFSDAEIATATCCPSCHTTSLPMYISHDVQININWVELCVLGEAAVAWAEAAVEPSGQRTVASIVERAKSHRPEDSWEEEDFTVPINWHELRILAMWAWNYSYHLTKEDSFRDTSDLEAIFEKISKYRPEGAPALTLVGEIKELQDQFPSAGLYVGDDCVVPPVDVTREDADSGDRP